MDRTARRWTGPPPTPEEHPTALIVNGTELVTVQTTPVQLRDWAVGFLFAEGLIQRPQDLLDLEVEVDEERGRVAVQLHPPAGWEAEGPRRRYMTSGCGRGLTFAGPQEFSEGTPPVASPVRVSHGVLADFQARMHAAAVRYAATGGMHVAALFSVTTGAMIAREDIGRHNAVDKAIGAALLAGWDPDDVVMLTSGRVSFEMCSKAARFGVGLVASRTAATNLAVQLAERMGMGLLGYLRPHGYRLYTGAHRLLVPVAAGHEAKAGAGAGPVSVHPTSH